ncbi:unnamed protein product [Adineta steineri]|uniref:F-box domain-containing protein n=1 Tax=Adineta steineri TaxID=433720 RepID=A0A814JE86_9BILA|nr:unnamed protein product [Adineta steineri]
MPLPQLVLDQFPVELIFDVFTYLTASEILHSFHNFSQYLRQCIRSYQHYKINFQSIRKREYDWICKVIHPDQIMSLTVSDDEETPGQMDLFFSNNQSFTRLEHLRLRNLEDFPNLLQMESALVALSACYPKQSACIFDQVYIRIKNESNNLFDKTPKNQLSIPVQSTENKDRILHTTKIENEPVVTVKGDYGQGTPTDQHLYTTRGVVNPTLLGAEKKL